jgi:hypothetical protein
MVKKELTIALVNLILRVLDRVGPTSAQHHRCRPCHHGWWRVAAHRPMPKAVLDLDRLHRIGGDPRAGTSIQAPVRTPNPRVRVLERPPSPFLDPPTYWPMEPSYPTTSLRSHREPPCAIHSWGPCPYPVAPRWTVSSSPSLREGGDGVTIAEEANKEDPVEVILVLNPQSRTAPRRTSRIQVSVQGRPTRTLAPRSRAREAGRGSPMTRSKVWPLPPPPSSVTTTPTPPLQQEENTTPPSLLSPIGGRILR